MRVRVNTRELLDNVEEQHTILKACGIQRYQPRSNGEHDLIFRTRADADRAVKALKNICPSVRRILGEE